MTAATPPAWSLCTQLLADHWDGFPRVSPRYDRRDDDGLVAQMRGGGEPDQMGDSAERGLRWGEGPHRGAMSCQSSRCLRCATVSGDNWGSQVRRPRHEGVISRHLVLTVPALWRTPFSQQAQAFLSPCRRGGGRCLEDVFSRGSGRALPGGSRVVGQTHGRHGPYHPHLHIITTSGGWDRQGRQGLPLDSVPYPLLRKQWQWYRRTRLRQTVQTQASKRLVAPCDTRDRAGGVTNLPKGDGPSRDQRVAPSLAKEVVRPSMSRRRLDRDEGHGVP
jgi:hypothetical protein